MNVVNVGEHVRNAIFTTYPHESKGPGERGERCTAVFYSQRTLHAKARFRSKAESVLTLGHHEVPGLNADCFS